MRKVIATGKLPVETRLCRSCKKHLEFVKNSSGIIRKNCGCK